MKFYQRFSFLLLKKGVGCLLLLCFSSYSFGQNQLENLGSSINTSVNEENPVLSPDGERLYFTRVKHPENTGGIMDGGDIWVSHRTGEGSWSEPENIGPPLNNKYENRIVGFSNDGNTVYLNNHYLKNGEKPNTRGLSKSTRVNGEWSFPENLDIPYYQNKSRHRSASIHAGGEIIVLTLQSYDTKGAEDLYVTFKQSPGEWSEPLNLGNINTEYQDMTPFIAPDGKTLYFASNGYEGFGSRDIFKTKRLDETWQNWSAPENLGPEVNTKGTELFYFIPDTGDFAYLTSTQNSDGYGDINRYRITPPEEETQEPDSIPIPDTSEPLAGTTNNTPAENTTRISPEEITISGEVRSSENQQPVSAEITVVPAEQDTTIMGNTVAAGSYEFTVPNDSAYDITVAAIGFDTLRQTFTNPGDSSQYNINLSLNPLDTGSTVRLDNVLFKRGSAELLGDNQSTLEKVVQMMEENPEMVIEVAGHTDNRGPAHLNMDLSQQRARKIKSFMVERGIAPDRIRDKGYGETAPLVKNNSEANRQKNRRVEFKILSR